MELRVEPTSPGTAFLYGDLDAESVPRLEAWLTGVADRAGTLVFDCRGLAFCDVAGVRALLRIAAMVERDGGRLELRQVRPGVARVFELAQVEATLRVRRAVEPSVA